MRIKLPGKNKMMIYTIILFFLSFIFQTVLAESIPLINYTDEVFTIIVVIAFYRKRRRFKKSNKEIYYLMISILIIGFFSNAFSGIKRETIAILIDAFSISKIIIVFICLNELLNTYVCDFLIGFFAVFFQSIVWLAISFYIPATVLRIDSMFGQYRFGIGTYGFIFGAGAFGYVLMVAFCVLSLYRYKLKHEKITRYMCLFLLVASLKGQAIMFVAFYLFMDRFLRKRKIRWYHIVLLVVLGGLVGNWQIQKYILDPNEARSVVILGSLKIAHDFFPFGAGFATFGTEMSKHFSFSPIYQMYNMTRIRGLNATDSYFLQDQYWSMLLGELGLIAFILFAIIYYTVFIQIRGCNVNDKCVNDKSVKNAIQASFFALMAAGIGSPYLTATQGMMCFIVYSVYLVYNENENRDAKPTKLVKKKLD